MVKLPAIIPLTDLRQDAAAVIKKVAASREPIVITQRGRAAAVILGMESYEHVQRELEILRLLATGEKEIENGLGFELDEVMTEAKSMLKATTA